MRHPGSSSRRRTAIATLVVGLFLASACSSPSIDGGDPSIGRDESGALYLIGRPCESTDLTAIAIVDGDAQAPVLRITFDEPTNAWDVVVPLDPLDLEQPGFIVAVFDEEGFEAALTNSGDDYQVLTETLSRTDGSTGEFLDPFRPGALPDNAAFDGDEVIEDPADYGCPRGPGKPWADVFEG